MHRFNELSDQNKGILFASATALLWGFLAIILKVTVRHVEPITVAWVRFVIAFVLLTIFLQRKDPGSLRILSKPPLLGVIAAIGLGLNYVGYIKGVELTTPSNAQIIIQIAPVLLAIVGLIFFKEKLTRIQATGFLLAIAGFVLFYQDQLTNLLSSTDTYNKGILIVVGAAFTWVVYASLQKILVRSIPTQRINLIIYGVPSLLLLPFVDYEGFLNLPLWVWPVLIFLGINTLLAYGFLAEAFKHIEANKVGIIITLNPMITIATMLVLTYMEVSWIEPERMSIPGFIGALLVVSGAILAVRSSRKKGEKNVEELNKNVETLTAEV
jgi:drug/metabolite transporter (DMT)-like permease